MAGNHKFCWDACVYISLIDGGVGRTAEQIKSLKGLESAIDNGDVQIFTSAITIPEVLECKLTESQRQKFEELITSEVSPPVWVDTRVARLAREIRDYYQEKEKMDIAIPDAIHLATAIHFKADALHTYDGCSKKKRPGDLLRLTQPIAGKYKLPIVIPEAPPAPEPEKPTVNPGQPGLFGNNNEGVDGDQKK